jgi:hypothetical protein
MQLLPLEVFEGRSLSQLRVLQDDLDLELKRKGLVEILTWVPHVLARTWT